MLKVNKSEQQRRRRRSSIKGEELPFMTGSRSSGRQIVDCNNIDAINFLSTRKRQSGKTHFGLILSSASSEIHKNSANKTHNPTKSPLNSIATHTSTTTKMTAKTTRPHWFIFNRLSIMLLLLLCCCLTSLSYVQPVEAYDSNLYNHLQRLKVIPDVIDSSSSPELAQVFLHGKQLKPGDPVAARLFRDIDIQKIEWGNSNQDAQHTLILLDLDREKKRSNNSSGGGQQTNMYNQFTTVNIPGHEILRGQAIVSMEVPTVPCSPSVKHRLLMLVFHQSQTIDLSDVIHIAASPGQSSKRENFQLGQFIQRQRLNLVAANIFMALGETNGVCSGSTSLYSFQNNYQSSAAGLLMIAMVIVGLKFSSQSSSTY